MQVIVQTLHSDDEIHSAPIAHPTETTPIALPQTIMAMGVTPVMMITAMEMKIRENLTTMNHLTRMVLVTHPTILMTPMMMYNTI
jgi:hypothetical protein